MRWALQSKLLLEAGMYPDNAIGVFFGYALNRELHIEDIQPEYHYRIQHLFASPSRPSPCVHLLRSKGRVFLKFGGINFGHPWLHSSFFKNFFYSRPTRDAEEPKN